MSFDFCWRAGSLALLAVLLGAQTPIHAQFSAPAQAALSASSIPAAELLQPEELNRILQSKAGDHPLVLQVGSHLLFGEAHIAGSEYAGAGSQATGLKQLQDRVASLPKSSFMVLYCGCCPWGRCPNLGPAFKLLHDLGFTNVKALYIADNFGSNWVDKGYPVEHGR
jgi:hypothetical protein